MRQCRYLFLLLGLLSAHPGVAAPLTAQTYGSAEYRGDWCSTYFDWCFTGRFYWSEFYQDADESWRYVYGLDGVWDGSFFDSYEFDPGSGHLAVDIGVGPYTDKLVTNISWDGPGEPSSAKGVVDPSPESGRFAFLDYNWSWEFELSEGEWFTTGCGETIGGAGGSCEFVEVPEPGSLGLLAAALVGLIGMGYRRKREA